MSKQSPKKIASYIAKPASQLSQLIRHSAVIEKANHYLYQIVSKQLRPHCSICNIANGELVIHVDSSTWATRLRFEQQQIVDLFNQQEDLPNTHGVRIQVRPNSINQKKPVRKMDTPSDQSVSDIESLASSVDDPQLAVALQRLADRTRRRGS